MNWKFWQRDPEPLSYAHVAMRLFNTPLMIEPGKLAVIERVIGPRVGLLPSQPAAALSEERRSRRPYAVENGTAIINVFGTLVHRAVGMEAESGLTSYQQLGREASLAEDDETVRRVLLWVDSPGGEAAGVWDFVDQLVALAAVKPVVALIDGQGASAAYAIASAAAQVYITQGSTAGSIGVIASHVDQSKMDEQMGVTVTHIIAGAHKADFSPHQPLSTEAAAEIQKLVDNAYDLFVGKVATARRLSLEAVRSTEARLFTPDEARRLSLVDGVTTLEQLVNMVPEDAGPPREETETMAESVIPMQVEVDTAQREQFDERVQAALAEARHGERARIQEILTLAGVELPPLLTDLCFANPVNAGDAAKQLLAAKHTVQKTKASAFLSDAPTPVDASVATEPSAADDALAAGRYVQQLREQKTARSLAVR